MVAIPKPEHTTVREMDRAVEARAQRRRSGRLGASQIGAECRRALWYAFRWCDDNTPPSGRVLRLFRRGHAEEQVFIDDLIAAGIQVEAFDPSTGQQYEYSAVGGHFVAKMDGAALGLPEAPKTWHVLSFKTSADKYFKKFEKDGFEKAEPKYVDQVMTEMHLAKIERAIILVVNKNDDARYGERVRYDKARAETLIEKARAIITAQMPLEKLSEKPEFYACKFCAARGVCHEKRIPPPCCRNCVHATPEMDGTARWSCAFHKRDLSLAEQQAGCEHHIYIPGLVPLEQRDANADKNYIEYRLQDGDTVRNGTPPAAFASTELHAIQSSLGVLAKDTFVQDLRTKADGRIVA